MSNRRRESSRYHRKPRLQKKARPKRREVASAREEYLRAQVASLNGTLELVLEDDSLRVWYQSYFKERMRRKRFDSWVRRLAGELRQANDNGHLVQLAG